jgi:hypothetical protein
LICSSQKLYISYTGIGNISLIAIGRYAQRMKSLSVVGCAIDSRGLVELGVKNHAISRTLQDLHLSNALKYSRNFHPTFRQTHSSQMSKRSQALERDKEKFQPINLESEFLSVPSVIMDRQWSLPEDNDSSFADDENDKGTAILTLI